MEDKMMKTAEFAKFCGTTRDTLLWYDKMGILKPAAVGENGYRYYLSRQFFDFDLISTLKQTGNSVREIKEYHSRRDYGELRELFREKSARLTEQIDELKRMKGLIDSVNESIETAMSCRFEEPELISMEPEYIVSTEVPEGYGWFQKNADQYIYRHIKSYSNLDGVDRYPLGTVIDASALEGATPVEKRYFYRANREAGTEEKPGGLYVRIFHRGDYSGIKGTIAAAGRFMRERGCVPGGDIYEYDIMSYPILESEQDFAYMILIPVIKTDNA